MDAPALLITSSWMSTDISAVTFTSGEPEIQNTKKKIPPILQTYNRHQVFFIHAYIRIANSNITSSTELLKSSILLFGGRGFVVNKCFCNKSRGRLSYWSTWSMLPFFYKSELLINFCCSVSIILVLFCSLLCVSILLSRLCPWTVLFWFPLELWFPWLLF